MQKNEITHIAENLFEEAVSAKSYLQIIQQFRENSEKFNREINCSPAFYNIVYNSLLESLFLNLFKLYDRGAKSLSIPILLKKMQTLCENDLDVNVLETYRKNGNKLTYRLNAEEEQQFSENVEQTKKLCTSAGVDYTYTLIFVTLQESVQLYGKRYRPLKNKTVDNLSKRRCKIGVHNDSETNFDYKKINEEFPLSDNEIECLVEFAIDFLQFCIEILTGVQKIPEYLNIRDWSSTLNLVRQGMNYQEIKHKNNKSTFPK